MWPPATVTISDFFVFPFVIEVWIAVVSVSDANVDNINEYKNSLYDLRQYELQLNVQFKIIFAARRIYA